MKIYTRIYSAQYEHIAKAQAPLSVAAGKMVCFQIGFPSEGFMEKAVIWQASGTNAAFQVELLNSQIPYPPGVYTSNASPADVLNMYRLQIPPTAALSQTSGNVLTLTDDNFGIGWRNIDGGFTLNQRYIYLLINPQSSGVTTTWNVYLQCRTDVG
jgi:hypothetical protein